MGGVWGGVLRYGLQIRLGGDGEGEDLGGGGLRDMGVAVG